MPLAKQASNALTCSTRYVCYGEESGGGNAPEGNNGFSPTATRIRVATLLNSTPAESWPSLLVHQQLEAVRVGESRNTAAWERGFRLSVIAYQLLGSAVALVDSIRFACARLPTQSRLYYDFGTERETYLESMKLNGRPFCWKQCAATLLTTAYTTLY